MIKKMCLLFAACMLFAFNANAAKDMKGFELSGHINTGMSFEHLSSQPAASFGSNSAQMGMQALRTDLTKQNQFLFYVGDVMLAASQNFNDKAKLRAELLFGRLDSFSNKNVDIGQVYGTVNLNKFEILMGRFIAPIGSESPYINENDLPTYSLGYNYLLPHFLTGVKGYYKLNDMFDFHAWAANNLRDTTFDKSNIPAFGANIGMNYDKFRFELSGAYSPEINATKYGKKTYLIDFNTKYNVNDNLAFFVEGMYRYDSAFEGFDANKYYFALGKALYKFSDKWDSVLQYSFLRDAQGMTGAALMNGMPVGQMHIWGPGTSASGIQGDYHEVALGGSYHITDAAKIQGMYKLDIVKPYNVAKGLAHSVVMNLAYNF